MPNELWIYDVIGESFFESGVTDISVRDELKNFDSTEPLVVRINSPGGSVSHSVAIKTMLDQWKGQVNVQIDGLAASGGSYIAMAGDQVTIAEGSRFMIHNPWNMAVGDAAMLRKEADNLEALGKSLNKAYTNRTGIPDAEIQAMMDEETWFTASEAIELGFADSLIEEHKAAAFVISKAMGFKNAPEPLVVGTKQRPENKLQAMKRKLELARIA